ncbi:MAG: acetone carboxylase subunit alpha, partial [Candidatus Lokiarchaeota archaeon]|nr:acetone carboxylase subunit alpha [Candidatus Lokiarchaeota archaeon]
NGEFEKLLEGDIVRKKNCTIYPIILENNDMIYYALSGGPGYGDPLERKVESVKQDLNNGIYTNDLVYNIYGVVAEYNEEMGEWVIDKMGTDIRREEIRAERKDKSLTFDDYWEQERWKITEDMLSEPVKRMYSESLRLSTKWRKEFLEFWRLPEDFQLEVK